MHHYQHNLETGSRNACRPCRCDILHNQTNLFRRQATRHQEAGSPRMRDVSINRFQMGPSTHEHSNSSWDWPEFTRLLDLLHKQPRTNAHSTRESPLRLDTGSMNPHSSAHNTEQVSISIQLTNENILKNWSFLICETHSGITCTRLALERNGNYKILMISSWSIAIAWALGNDMDSEQYFGSIHKFIHMRREEALRDRMCVQWTNHLVLTTKLAFSTTLVSVSILVRLSLSLVLFP